MKEYYKDFTGCTASIEDEGYNYRLIVCTPYGNEIRNSLHKTMESAKKIMQNDASGTMKKQ